MHRESLVQQLQALRNSRSEASNMGTEVVESDWEGTDEWENIPMETDELPQPDSDLFSRSTIDVDVDSSDDEKIEQKPRKPRRTVPDDDSKMLYRRWNDLLLALESPWAEYWKLFSGSGTSSSTSSIPSCSTPGCAKPLRTVLALYWDRKDISITFNFKLLTNV